jgi:hypothetical protein
MSLTKAERDEWYANLRAVVLGGSDYCQARATPGCWERATEVHHAMGRAPSVMLNVATYRLLCGPCHRWAGDHPTMARRSGMSRHRNGPVPELEDGQMEVRCRSCEAEIVWAITEGGQSIPLEAEGGKPRAHEGGPKGRIVWTGEYRGAALLVEMLREQDQAESLLDGVPEEIWVSHFAYCPDAKGWRKRK